MPYNDDSTPASQSKNPKKPIPGVHYRSKTILLLVAELEDVAPVAALCALLGDLYRHRTLFANEPMVVLRVAVTPCLRYYFVSNSNSQTATTTSSPGKVVQWRAHHEISSSNSSWNERWKTHMGGPDSVWCLEHALEEAFWGHSMKKSAPRISYVSHDDGGMADMILVGRASSLSLTLWQRLAHLLIHHTTTVSPSSKTAAATKIPPLVIATVGSLRGMEWVSGMAFSLEQQRQQFLKSGSTEGDSRSQPPRQSRRPIVLVGFPTTLWHCRLVREPERIHHDAKQVMTPYREPFPLVLMVGRDSSSEAPQSVLLRTLATSSSSSSPPKDQQYYNCQETMQLLRQTLFPPKTILELALPLLTTTSTTIPPAQAANKTANKSYLYPLLWSLLQDPHMIQFPCYMAIHGTPLQSQSQQPASSVGTLICSVLEELLYVLQCLYLRHLASNKTSSSSSSSSSSISNNSTAPLVDPYDQEILEALIHPMATKSLLAKLLGTPGGVLLEDLTNNRMPEIMSRLAVYTTTPKNDDHPPPILRRRRILEPLLTRAATAEWERVMLSSPFSSSAVGTTNSTDTEKLFPSMSLYRQMEQDTIAYGLGLVLQLGTWMKLNLPAIQRVVVSSSNNRQRLPYEAFGIHSVPDLLQFLSQQEQQQSPVLGAMILQRNTPTRSRL
jgi:hypothetical protein